MQTRTYPVHTLSMFRLETDDNGRALLVIISRDDCGQMWEQAFTMDPLMTCTLRAAMIREHGHVQQPPLAPELVAVMERAAARRLAAGEV